MKNIKRINDYLYEIPKTGKMRVPARIYASPKLMNDIYRDNAIEQAKNVAWLPGIQKYSFAMPDIHWGYGFPIGGVAAFNIDEGVVSPGGVGYDINCGVRLLKTNLSLDMIQSKKDLMVNNLFNNIPSGVGSKGQIKLSYKEEKKVLEQGAVWAINNGYGTEQDLENIEENGKMSDADYQLISNRALERGKAQLGTLGSGNHFVEVGVVQELFDQDLAQKLGLEKNQITIIIHTGSRGFGHQVCDDYIKIMQKASSKYGIELPDRQLCCAPITSKEGKEYLAAMACAVNFSFCNRQIISHRIEDVIQKTFGKSYKTSVVYEVAHNIAKLETHLINGKKTKLCVHRKGATRAFGPHHPELSPMYQSIGQPVLIPGDMGRYSYVLLGTEKAMTDTFGSTCHGAGRVLSRRQAAKASKGRSLFKELEDRGITVRASSRGTMAEEISDAYKDVANVVDSIVGAGISKKVAKLKPIAVIKG